MTDAIGWALVHSLWQGLLIAAVVSGLLLAVRSAHIRYIAGCAALLAMLASFALTLIHLLPASNAGLTSLLKPELPPWRPLPEATDNNSVPYLIPLLTPLWFTGVCLFYLYTAAGWVGLHRLRSRCIRGRHSLQQLASELRITRPVLLLESLLADTPVVLGHFRPVILVPLGFLTGLPADQVEAILLHELAHIRRSDYLVNACQRLIEGLFFYHPAVWWISHIIRTERENCCDDIVVALRGDPHTFAAALTTLEQNRTGNWAVAAAGGNLMKRITRLLYPQNQRAASSPVLTVAALLLTTAMLLPAWHARQPEPTPWQKWLNQDVVYIISDQEKAAFEKLTTDDERQHFIEQFWERRNPAPGSAENKFKEEHYRRIAYANNHFAHAPSPGWRTDRGRIYIKYGPPDEIDSHPSGGPYKRPDSEGGATVSMPPFEDWLYRSIKGVGTNVMMEFVDAKRSGDFRMTLDPNPKGKKVN